MKNKLFVRDGAELAYQRIFHYSSLAERANNCLLSISNHNSLRLPIEVFYATQKKGNKLDLSLRFPEKLLADITTSCTTGDKS